MGDGVAFDREVVRSVSAGLEAALLAPFGGDGAQLVLAGPCVVRVEQTAGVPGRQVLGDPAHPAVVGGAGAAVKPKRARVSTMTPPVDAARPRARCRTRGCHDLRGFTGEPGRRLRAWRTDRVLPVPLDGVPGDTRAG
jgi:hypothetical protein